MSATGDDANARSVESAIALSPPSSGHGRAGRVAVTGAGGFIGSCLINRLARDGGTPVGLVRTSRAADLVKRLGGEPVFGDLGDQASIERLLEGADVVIHAAARLGNGDPAAFLRDNAIYSEALFRSAVAANVSRYVFVSSIEVYGNLGSRVVDERDAIALCGHAYADSKVRAEQRLVAASRTYAAPELVIARPGMVFGPGSPFWTTRFVDLLRRRKLVLVGRGAGSVFPIYIDDLVDGLMLACTVQGGAGRAFNFVDTTHVTWAQWTKAYEAIVGHRGSFRLPERSTRAFLRTRRMLGGSGRERWLEVMTRRGRILCTEAHSVLGWAPKVGYDMGMSLTAEWVHGGG